MKVRIDEIMVSEYNKNKELLTKEEEFRYPNTPCWLLIVDDCDLVSYMHFTHKLNQPKYFAFSEYFDIFSLRKMNNNENNFDWFEYRKPSNSESNLCSVHEKIRRCSNKELRIIKLLQTKKIHNIADLEKFIQNNI